MRHGRLGFAAGGAGRFRVGPHRHGHTGVAPAAGAAPLSALQSAALPLAALPTGAAGAIMAFTGCPVLIGRLAAMGLTPGARVAVARNPGFGPVIILVRDTRLALGRNEALQILVTPEAADHA